MHPPNQRPPEIEELRAQLRGEKYRPAMRIKNQKKPLDQHDIHRLFTVERANRWMEVAARQPAAKMLFGQLWHQGELCMMFAESNIGKSILAVQIGESIANRSRIAQFACQPKPQQVLYIDFELSEAQFRQRYNQKGTDHLFSHNFFRAQYNLMADTTEGVDEDELLFAAIAYKIQLVKATVVIIDNITCLRGGTENAAVALALMKRLKKLKTKHNLSIMVLAHTPKRRNPTQPITADDLHGSKLLVNFADSAFALGKSNADAGLCYLKQLKQRNTRQRYGEENVALCRIQKTGGFLHFKFEGHSHENLHLLSHSYINRQHSGAKIADLIAKGFSHRDIGRILNIPKTTVTRLAKANVRTSGCADDVRFTDDVGCADDECDNETEEQTPIAEPESTEGAPPNSLAHEGDEGLTGNAPPPDDLIAADDPSLNYLPWEARLKIIAERNGLPPPEFPGDHPIGTIDPKTNILTIPISL